MPYYVQSFPTPSKVKRYDVIEPPAPAWSVESVGCIWRQHGVWEWNTKTQKPVVLRSSYFRTKPGSDQPIDFYSDYLRPFVRDFAAAMHAIRPDWMVVAGSVPNEVRGAVAFAADRLSTRHPGPRSCSRPTCAAASTVRGRATHRADDAVYDLAALFYRSFGNISVNVQGISRGMNVLRALHFGNRSTKRLYALQISASRRD